MNWEVLHLLLLVLSVLLVTPIAPGKSGLAVQKQVAQGRISLCIFCPHPTLQRCPSPSTCPEYKQ